MKTRKLMGILAGLFFAGVCLLPLSSPPAARAEEFFATSGPIKWKVYEIHHGRLRPRNPYRLAEGGIAFDFLETPDTALLVTSHRSYEGELLGDLTGKFLTIAIRAFVDPATQFTYGGEPDGCPQPASVRLYFETDTSGPFEETDYWSSGTELEMETIKNRNWLVITPMSTPSNWFDSEGHPGSHDPAHTAAFTEALQNVERIGLAFGGGCSYQNGVGIVPGTGSGYFRLQAFIASP